MTASHFYQVCGEHCGELAVFDAEIPLGTLVSEDWRRFISITGFIDAMQAGLSRPVGEILKYLMAH